MRSKVTVVLLFLNVVLFAYIFYFEPRWKGEQDLLTAKRRVLPVEIASMDTLTRTSRTGEVVKLEKRGESWWLTKPYEWPANVNAVAQIHNELKFLEHKTSFPVADLAKNGQSLADYGLADPAYKLEFTAAGKTDRYTLLVGDNTPIGNRLYLLSPDGARVHVVDRSLAETVSLPVAALRNESIFTIPVFEVRSLNIQTAAPSNLKVRLRRDAAGRWGFESPILARAAKNTVEVTINALNGLTAKKFLESADADPGRTGLNSPDLRVTLEGNARRETLLLGQSAGTGEFYAKIEDKAVVFTAAVPDALLQVLRLSQEALRDPHVVDFDPATVTSLTLVAPGRPEVALQKLEAPTTPTTPAAASAERKSSWQVVARNTGQAPVTFSGDPELIEELLKKLQLLSARKFLSEAPSAADLEDYGFARPEREITLGLSTGGGLSGKDPSTVTLQIGVGVKPELLGKAFARVTNSPFIYEILPDILDDTPAQVPHYLRRTLRELPAGARVTSVALLDLASNNSLYSHKIEADKTWEAALAAEPEATRRAVGTLVAQLHSLKAQRFTAETFATDHADTPDGPRPWRYRLDYAIAFPGNPPDQATPSSLFLTERLGGATQLAGTADFGGVVFAVSQEMLDALFALTYGAKTDPGAVPPPATPPAPATVPETKP